MVERLVRDEEAAGSNPAGPTISPAGGVRTPFDRPRDSATKKTKSKSGARVREGHPAGPTNLSAGGFSKLEIFRAGFILCRMDSSTTELAAAELKAMQDSIYLEKILRARRQTPEERLADVFELSNHQFGMMLAGAMHKIKTSDQEKGWEEVRRWMRRLDRVREHGLYSAQRMPS